MTSDKHSIGRTWGFLVALGLFAALWMGRPEYVAFELIPFPKWEDWGNETLHALNPEAIDTLLSAYDFFDSLHRAEVLPVHCADSTTALNDIDLKDSVVMSSPKPFTQQIGEAPIGQKDHALSKLHPNLRLQGSETAFVRLGYFFNRLQNKLHQGPLHIFHFGDSQIEGDRITRTLRTSWQNRWGGYGLGYLAPKPLVAPASIVQSTSAGWIRHARYGRRDTTIKHNRYGLLAAFASHDESIASDQPPWIRLKPNSRASLSEQHVHSIKMLFGKSESSARLSCYLDSTFIGTFEIPADSVSSELTIPLSSNSGSVAFKSIEFQFNGPAPEIDAIGMFPDSGLVFHNVAMRGSSGTLFRQLDRAQFTHQLQSHDVGMVILQFGGNAVPYIADTAAVKRYGQWFASQIRLFQSLTPDAAIVIIGPSDMATKQGQYMATYPMLVPVRNALRQVALDENVLFWDVFEVMGGQGSMAAWVASDPQLASPDHVHFTRRGANKIASLLLQSLDAEWESWERKQHGLNSTSSIDSSP